MYRFVDKKYLPVEYGGEARSLVEKDRDQRQQIVDFRYLQFYIVITYICVSKFKFCMSFYERGNGNNNK